MASLRSGLRGSQEKELVAPGGCREESGGLRGLCWDRPCGVGDRRRGWLSSPECYPVPSLTFPPWASSVDGGRCTPGWQASFFGSDSISLSRGRALACLAEFTASHSRASPHPKPHSPGMKEERRADGK